jgi:hypothetical protein
MEAKLVFELKLSLISLCLTIAVTHVYPDTLEREPDRESIC